MKAKAIFGFITGITGMATYVASSFAGFHPFGFFWGCGLIGGFLAGYYSCEVRKK